MLLDRSVLYVLAFGKQPNWAEDERRLRSSQLPGNYTQLRKIRHTIIYILMVNIQIIRVKFSIIILIYIISQFHLHHYYSHNHINKKDTVWVHYDK